MKYHCNKGAIGNSIDIDITCQDTSAEVRADIRVDELSGKRVWGQIINCEDKPVPNCLVKLARITEKDGKHYYEGIAHTITDCQGFYQFDICEEDACYKIIVNKAVTGQEKIIETGGGNCHACEAGQGYNPCDRQEPIVVPYHSCECKKPTPTCRCSCNQQTEQCEEIPASNKTTMKCNYATYTR